MGGFADKRAANNPPFSYVRDHWCSETLQTQCTCSTDLSRAQNPRTAPTAALRSLRALVAQHWASISSQRRCQQHSSSPEMPLGATASLLFPSDIFVRFYFRFLISAFVLYPDQPTQTLWKINICVQNKPTLHLIPIINRSRKGIRACLKPKKESCLM